MENSAIRQGQKEVTYMYKNYIVQLSTSSTIYLSICVFSESKINPKYKIQIFPQKYKQKGSRKATYKINKKGITKWAACLAILSITFKCCGIIGWAVLLVRVLPGSGGPLDFLCLGSMVLLVEVVPRTAFRSERHYVTPLSLSDATRAALWHHPNSKPLP